MTHKSVIVTHVLYKKTILLDYSVVFAGMSLIKSSSEETVIIKVNIGII